MNRPILLFCTGANGKICIPFENVKFFKEWRNGTTVNGSTVILKSEEHINVLNEVEEIIDMIEGQTNGYRGR